MASSNLLPKGADYQQKQFLSLARNIEDKYKTMMLEMDRKLDRKDNLLEAALEQIQKSRLENDKLKNSESQLKSRLRDIEAEIEDLKTQYNSVVVKERICNNELQAARKEAIREMQTMLTHPRTSFGIKKMGEISQKPFEDMRFAKCSDKDWKKEAAKLCSLWEETVKNPHWYPFKRIKIDGIMKEAIDENDAKLKELKKEGNEKVYEAVVNALLELNEYNPSGRYPILELWNNKENKKASLKEIVEYLIKQVKISKPKRKRNVTFY